MSHADALIAQDAAEASAVGADPAAAKRKVERDGKQSGKFKKVCLTDPDATMATSARNRRLEPAYKQHTAIDDAFGVVLDVAVTTGEANEGDHVLLQLDAVAAITGVPVKTATADQGYAYGKVYGGLERRGIDPVNPAKRALIRSRVSLRRFRYDARHDILKCSRGRILRPQRRVPHGRFFYSRSRDCRTCPLRGDCLSAGRVNKAVVVSDDHPALLRARRRKERWSQEDARLYQRHRWRSEGFHGEAKTWHGLARAVRRGLQNMRIQAFLTAAAVNLKRLAKALAAMLVMLLGTLRKRASVPDRRSARLCATTTASSPKLRSIAFFNSPRVHFMCNAMAHVGKTQRRIVSAWVGTAFAQDGAAVARTQWREIADQARPRVPKLAALMDDAEADVLAYMGFPVQHRAKLHSTNPLERLNGEINRRSDVVGIFPTKPPSPA